MVIGICEITLRLHSIHSLKEKRSVLKPLLLRIGQRFNVSVAETGEHDKWQAAVLAVACVAANSAQAHNLLERVLHFVERDGNVQIVESSLQII